MLLLGMVVSGAAASARCCADFSQVRLIQVVQGAALVTMVLNLVALWKQEARDPAAHRAQPRRGPRSARPGARFAGAGRSAALPGRGRPRHRRLQHAGHPARALRRRDPDMARRRDHHADRADGLRRAGRLRAGRALARRTAATRTASRRSARWSASSAFAVRDLRRAAATRRCCSASAPALIGFGGGLFSVGTLTAAMDLETGGQSGLALGAWGAVQATAAGLAIALGGALRDVVSRLADAGRARPGADRARRPATASSTTSRSGCCSPRWSRSARWSRTHARAAPRPAPGRSSAWPNCPADHARHTEQGDSSWEPEPSPPTSTSRSRALRVLGLLRRPDLLPAPRGQARGLSARVRPLGAASTCRAGRPCPSRRPSCCATAARCSAPNFRGPTQPLGGAPSAGAPAARR